MWRSVAVERLDQVVAELAFDRTVDDAQGLFEDDLVDGADHLAWADFTQITAALAGRANGEFLCQDVEGFTFGNALFELFGFFGGFDQDVAGLCFHDAGALGVSVKGRDYA